MRRHRFRTTPCIAPKSLAERVRILEEKVGDKPLDRQFCDQAELIDRRFDEEFRTQAELIDRRLDESFRAQAELIDRLFAVNCEEFERKSDAKLDRKLEPITRDLGILREGIKILLTRRR